MNGDMIMKELFTKKAIELVIMDAIEKGHTEKNELMEYMKSAEFNRAVSNYVSMFESDF
jgi:hypothetical protein